MCPLVDMTDRCLNQPDGVLGVCCAQWAIRIENEVGYNAAVVVMSWIEVSDDPRRDAEAAHDCGDRK